MNEEYIYQVLTLINETLLRIEEQLKQINSSTNCHNCFNKPVGKEIIDDWNY